MAWQISTSGAPMHPRLQRILNGEVFAIQFGDAVTICAIGIIAHRYPTKIVDLPFCPLDAEYMDRLMLKSATDRTLGVGVINGESELLHIIKVDHIAASFLLSICLGLLYIYMMFTDPEEESC